jgi:hypothetical protein
MVMAFTPNKKFKKKYDWLYKQDPLAANTCLLVCELADERGQVETSPEELAILFAARFEDPEEYVL